MKAKLIALAGPAEGLLFPVEDRCVIGREKQNEIGIEDHSMSRRHCVIESLGSGCTLRDLGSKNGTFVNDLPVAEHVLEDRDEIRIGNSVFLFLYDEADRADSVSLDHGSSLSASTILLRKEDAQYLDPDRAAAAVRSSDRAQRDVRTLLKIAAEIPRIQDLESLQEKLLELIFEAIPAGRGAILLRESLAEDFSPFHRSRFAQAFGEMQISNAVVEKVSTGTVGLLSPNDLGAGELLAVPLPVFEKTPGVLYLDTPTAGSAFDQGHLQLLAGIAGMVAPALANALELRRMKSENRRLQKLIHLEHNMVGESRPMRAVLEFIAKVAPTVSTVLIRGETGTGKELVARAIHRNSPRATKAFVAVNCATLTETLLESELFGHERGAFTGAVATKKGRLEEAEGGVVFLDEVAELALTLQAKLLRVLEEREFRRVGGTRTIKTDMRLIAATNRDLETLIREGAFRSDLYYRLNVVSVRLPALRDRKEDIPLLANYFVQKHARRSGRQMTGLSFEARACLTAYDWPGNIRELENAVERAVVLGSTPFVLAEDLPESIAELLRIENATGSSFHDAVREAKRVIVLKRIDEAGGNLAEAARLLGLHPSNLHRLIRQLDLRGAVDRDRESTDDPAA